MGNLEGFPFEMEEYPPMSIWTKLLLNQSPRKKVKIIQAKKKNTAAD